MDNPFCIYLTFQLQTPTSAVGHKGKGRALHLDLLSEDYISSCRNIATAIYRTALAILLHYITLVPYMKETNSQSTRCKKTAGIRRSYQEIGLCSWVSNVESHNIKADNVTASHEGKLENFLPSSPEGDDKMKTYICLEVLLIPTILCAQRKETKKWTQITNVFLLTGHQNFQVPRPGQFSFVKSWMLHVRLPCTTVFVFYLYLSLLCTVAYCFFFYHYSSPLQSIYCLTIFCSSCLVLLRFAVMLHVCEMIIMWVGLTWVHAPLVWHVTSLRWRPL